VKNVAGVPGEGKSLEATLLTTLGDKPIAGKKVSFRLVVTSGLAMGNGFLELGAGTTDPAGNAKVAWVLPELVQASYVIKASFPGDDDTGAAADDGNLVVVKAMSAFNLSPAVTCSAAGAPSEHNPNPGSCSMTLSLKRTSDNAMIAGPITLVVNNVTSTLPAKASVQSVALPGNNATAWKVKVQFAGDKFYQATVSEKSYVRP
jgi:hypothetical protein